MNIFAWQRHGLSAAAALALLALLLAATWPIRDNHRIAVNDPATLDAPAPQPAPPSAFALSAAAEVAASRPLFAADRKRYQVTAAPVAMPTQDSQDLPRLMGTIQRGDTARALFEGSDGSIFSAGLDQNVGGWRLQTIAPAEVELTRDGRSLRLNLDPAPDPKDSLARQPSKPMPVPPPRPWQSDDLNELD